MILYLLNFLQLLPVILSYQYDLFILLFFLFLFFKNIKKTLPLILIIYILFFSIIIYLRLIFFTGDDIIIPKFIRDIRPFVVLLILYYLKLIEFNEKNIYIFFTSLIFVLTLPNLLGVPNIIFNQLHIEWYLKFTQIWSNESTIVRSFYIQHGVPIPVAGIAAIGQRFSSFFYMPAVAGINFLLFFLFYSYFTYLLIIKKYKSYKVILLNLFVLSIIYANGIFSGSSVFQWGIYLIPILLLFFYMNFLLKIISMLLGAIIIFLFAFYYNDSFIIFFNGATGNRYSTSDIVTLIPYLSISEFLSGLYYIPEFAEPKAFGGDSAILAKILQGGIFYYILYISSLLIFSYSIISKNVSGKFLISKPFFYTSCILILICETGFPATTQPLGTVIYFTLIILGSIFIEKKFVVKEF